MKGLLCAECVDFRAIAPSGVARCRCGNVEAWWVDPQRGVARFWARNRETAYGLGVHNHFLQGAIAMRGKGLNAEWRDLHDNATASPGYLFDASNRACWALIFKPGLTSDTSFAEEPYGEADIDAELDRRLGPVGDG